MSKKVIKWEKWKDPFANEAATETVEEEERAYKDSYEQLETLSTKTRYSGPLLVGPMGVIPINENNAPSKVYNFHMMYTNFNLSDQVVKKIEECSGVETLDVFTRYRARIGIGKVFDAEKVKKRIKKALCQEPKAKAPAPTEKLDKLDLLKRQLANKHKFWAIAIMSNNEIKLYGGETQEYVENKLSEIEYEELHRSWS